MAMERDAEIAQIMHELEILRARYALYAKWGRIVKVFLMAWLPLFAIAVVAMIAKAFLYDVVIGGFFAGMTLIVAGLIWWVVKTSASERSRFRWIDLVSPLPRFSAPYGDFRSFVFGSRLSDACLIEQQISERERRLAELGAVP
jgi:hypothetical protein